MPDTNPPEVTRTEADLPMMLFGSRSDQSQSNRRWLCPSDHTIAAYADGVLSKHRRAWVEFHLSGCQRCRLLVADIVKSQRESDLSLPPVQLVQKAMGLVGRRPVPRRWVWAPVGALAGIVLVSVVTVVLRKPERLVVLSPPAPPAPLIAKSEPTAAARTPVRDVVRKPRTPQLLPTIVSPRADSVTSSDRLQFSWKAVPHSRNYEVRVVKSDGDQVWEGQTDKSALQFPLDVTVKDGPYFVWITAYLEDGRIAKSAPVRFLVKR
jgi:putative zinc finger protein